MRIGLSLDPFLGRGWTVASEFARGTEEHGIDVLFVSERAEGHDHDPLLVAASLAAVTRWSRIVVEVRAGMHPVHLAERAAVADLASRGRLTVVIHSDDESLLRETVEVLTAATAARPFRHVGEHWTIPAVRPENEDATDEPLRVIPAPAQLALPLWVSGRAAASVSADAGLSRLQDEGQVEPRDERGPRPHPVCYRHDPGGGEVDTLTEGLLADRDELGVDIALIELAGGTSWDDSYAAVDRIATAVVPRVQLASLPAGLEEFWTASGAVTP